LERRHQLTLVVYAQGSGAPVAAPVVPEPFICIALPAPLPDAEPLPDMSIGAAPLPFDGVVVELLLALPPHARSEADNRRVTAIFFMGVL
jgi:hypothetical protein